MSIQNSKPSPLDEWIPRYYNPFIFFGLTNVVGVVGLIVLLSFSHQMHWLEWLAIPIAVLFANWVEYKTHCGPMHHRSKWIPILHKRHVLIHHQHFRPTNMPIQCAKEAYIVLFPPWSVLLVFMVVTPIFFVLWLFTTTNIAILFVATCIAYYLIFDWMHLIYHLPASSPVFKIPFIRRWQYHHQLHHDPHLMQQYNFNIAFPIWDHIYGTYYLPKKFSEGKE